MTDAAGEVVARMSFDSFGQRRTSSDWSPDTSDGSTPATGKTTGSSTTRGYTGHEQLDHFGLVHMNGRIYDAELGRFLSPDPIIALPGNSQSYNRYAYVLNNPHRYTDPSGYSPHSVMIGQPLLLPDYRQEYAPSNAGYYQDVFAGWKQNPAAYQNSFDKNGGMVLSGDGFTVRIPFTHNPAAQYYSLGHIGAIIEQHRAAAEAQARLDVARFRSEQRASFREHNQELRRVLEIQPVQELTPVASGVVGSGEAPADYQLVVNPQPERNVGIEIAKGFGEGLAQGALNAVNGVQDSLIGTANLAISTSPLYIGYRTLGGDPFSISSPGWARGMVMDETDFEHNFSKMAGAFGIEMLAGTKGAGLFEGVARSGGLTNAQLVQRAATKAEAAIGGTGRFAGTAKHNYSTALLERYQSIYGDRGLMFKVPFNNGPGNRGFLDVLDTRNGIIYDWKFGYNGVSAAVLNASRQMLKYQRNFNLPTQVIKP